MFSVGVETLCTKSETTYFSCTTQNKKIISLCGNVYVEEGFGQLVGTDKPWLQYRFGAREKIELVYPAQKKESVLRFKSERIRAMGGLATVDAVLFLSGGIAYSVTYSVTGDTQEEFEGVTAGDPSSYALNTSAKRRNRYPDVKIACAERANTKKFFQLVEYLSLEDK